MEVCRRVNAQQNPSLKHKQKGEQINPVVWRAWRVRAGICSSSLPREPLQGLVQAQTESHCTRRSQDLWQLCSTFIFILKSIYWFEREEKERKGEEGREGERLIVPVIDTFIGCLFCRFPVRRWNLQPGHIGMALTNWATWPGKLCNTFKIQKTMVFKIHSKGYWCTFHNVA